MHSRAASAGNGATGPRAARSDVQVEPKAVARVAALLDLAQAGEAFGAEGEQLLAFNCGGPAFLFSRDKLVGDLGPRLVALVKQLETNLGRG